MERVDTTGYMDHFGVGEAAHDVEYGVGLANVREELVAETFTLAGAFDDTRDVDELHRGGNNGVGLDHRDDAIHARIGHGNNADVGIDGAEGIVRRWSLGGCEGVEDSRFSHVGEADNSAVQRH